MQRKDVLAMLQKKHAISREGADWLKLAVDPFHDYNHQIAGYPDTDGSQTVVSCYQYQADIVAPAGVAGNWDCHVFNNPLATSGTWGSFNQSADWSVLKQYNPDVTQVQGPLTILTGVAGGSLQARGAVVATNAAQVLPISGTSDLSSGISRVIGMGYEVTNTTAEINKQGSVTVYRMPQSHGTNVASVQNAAVTQQAVGVIQRYRRTPDSLAQCNLLKGTRTWDAASGVYAVCVQNSIENPLVQETTELVMFDEASQPLTTTSVLLSGYQTVGGSSAYPLPSTIIPAVQQTIPFDSTGSYFTGLSNATILTVKLKVYVERAPTFADAALAVLASPSAGYDAAAFTFYSHMISELPIATKVLNNASGDWWRFCLKVLGTVAGGLGVVMNPILPGAAVLGAGVQVAARSASGVAEQMKRDKAQKTQKRNNSSSGAVAISQPSRNSVVAQGSLAQKGKR